MFAVICPSQESPGSAMLPIAGRPLLARQLQWLRSAGCEQVAVAVSFGADEAVVTRWLDNDPLGFGVVVVPSATPCDPRAVAAGARFPADVPLVVLPSDVIGGGDLKGLVEEAAGSGSQVELAAPETLGGTVEGGSLQILVPGQEPVVAVAAGVWGACVRTPAEALLVGAAALMGKLPPLLNERAGSLPIHAAEHAPGIWVARGARVEPGAELIAPVLVGPGAFVCSGAKVGPAVFIGDRAVVGAGAVLAGVIVARDTMVGEGLSASNMLIEPEGSIDISTGARVYVGDPLVLSRRPPPRSLVPGSAFAVVAVVMVLVGSLLGQVASARAPESPAPARVVTASE